MSENPYDDEAESEEEDWSQSIDDHLPSKSVSEKSIQDRICQGAHDGTFKSRHTRVIVHVDLDCFYAQVEMIRNPSLRDKPLGIQQKNIIVTCNYVARSRGLSKLMYLKEAQEKCPDLIIVKGEDLTHYRETSYQVTDLLLRYSPLVERLGMDENFVDVTNMIESEEWRHLEETSEVPGFVYSHENGHDDGGVCSCGCERRLRVGTHIAKYFKDRLYSELGLTSCAGVSHNKLLAKLVGSTHKPNKQTLLQSHLAGRLILSLGECRKIPGIGRSMAMKLASLGVVSIGDLRKCSLAELEEEFGSKNARTMIDLSFGIDDSAVTVTGKPQSMSDEDSFKRCSDFEDAKRRMEELLRSLLKRVEHDGRIPQTVRVTVRPLSQNWHRESRQGPIPASVTGKMRQGDMDAVVPGLLQVCSDLFQKVVNVHAPFHLTLINIAVCKLTEAPAGRGIARFFGPQSAEGSRPPDPRPPPATTARGDQGQGDCHQRHQPGRMEEASQNLQNEGNNSKFTSSVRPQHSSSADSDDVCVSLEEQKRCGVKRGSERTEEEQVRKYAKMTFVSMEEDCHSEMVTNADSDNVRNDGKSPGGKNVKHTEPPLGGDAGDRLNAPPGVDPEVFFALPRAFQLDVLAQYRTNSSTSTPNTKENTAHTPQGVNTSCMTNSASADRNSGVRPSSSRRSITSFFNKKNQEVAVTETNFSCLGSGKQSVETANRLELNPSTSSTHEPDQLGNNLFIPNSSTKVSPARHEQLEIPPDIDRDVFMGLPPEIQKELRADWRRRLAERPETTAGGAKVLVTDKKRVSGQGSLDKFLKKK